MPSAIEVTDAGPIEGTFPIDTSKGPGVYEFRGRRGSGKTTCINSIELLSGHRVDITLHDGALSGKVEGFGAIAPIGSRKRRKGSFEPDTIDAEKFSVIDLLDPQGKTPEVRDATRIKALASLSGMEADPSLYYELAGSSEAFEKLEIADTKDPVVLASRVKQAFDSMARSHESRAETEAGHAAPLEHVPDDIDLDAESDLSLLAEERDAARDNVRNLEAAIQSSTARGKGIAKAKERIAELEENYDGPSAKEALDHVKHARMLTEEAEKAVIAAEEQLAQAKRDMDKARQNHETSQQLCQSAVSHEAALQQLKEIADQDNPAPPSKESLEDAVRKSAEATDAYDRGVIIRDITRNHEKAQVHRKAEQEAMKHAEEARKNGGRVFELLAHGLNTQHLKIQSVDGNPRLFVEHPKRGKTAFDQVNGLSDGERVDFTLKELLPHLESPGVLPIPQRVWQDLQPSDRKALHKLAVDNGLFLFGAQVDDGDLRVVYYGEQGTA